MAEIRSSEQARRELGFSRLSYRIMREVDKRLVRVGIELKSLNPLRKSLAQRVLEHDRRVSEHGYQIQRWEGVNFAPPEYYPANPLRHMMRRDFQGIYEYYDPTNKNKIYGWRGELSTLHRQTQPGPCFFLSCADAASTLLFGSFPEKVVRKYTQDATQRFSVTNFFVDVKGFQDELDKEMSKVKVVLAHKIDKTEQFSLGPMVDRMITSLEKHRIPVISISMERYLDNPSRKTGHVLAVKGVSYDSEGRATLHCIDNYLGYIPISAERAYYALRDHNFNMHEMVEEKPYRPEELQEIVKTNFPQGGTVFDGSSGRGTAFAIPLTELGFEVTAVDNDASMIAELNACRHETNIHKVVHDDVETFLDITTQQFNVIITSNSLMFNEKQKAHKIIEKMQKHTKDGGLNVIAVLTSDDESSGVLGNPFKHLPTSEEIEKLYPSTKWERIYKAEYVTPTEDHGGTKPPHKHAQAELVFRKRNINP